jgi:transcription elongation factor GreA
LVRFKSDNIGAVGLGNIVTVEIDGRQKTFQILGSSETDPQKGVISHSSPIGMALMGCRVGDVAEVKLKDKTVEYKVLRIE